MHDELRFHLESRAAHFVTQGLSPEDAARRARLEFGNPAAWQDRCREMRRIHLLDDFVADVRFTFGGFRQHKLLSTIVIATLTFGIGISSGVLTMFSIALRPPVQRDPDSFVKVYSASTNDCSRSTPFASTTVEEYLAFRDGLGTVRSLAAYGGLMARLGTDAAKAGTIHLVTCNFFDVYGPDRPRLGRLLQPSDCDEAAAVVVLSHTGWLTRFGGDESVVGRVVSIAGVPLTIVGVAPPTDAALGMGLAWLPYTLRGRLRLGDDPRAMVNGHYGHDRWLKMSGRLAPGTTREQAAAELAVIAARQDRLHPGQTSSTVITNGAIVNEPTARASVLSVVALVMGALSCLVLIACANVATLLLSRADARQREMAVRLSLGAGRARVMRMLLTETLTLAAVAGAASLYVAYQVPKVMVAWLVGVPPESPMTPDWRVFTYLAATVCLAGVAAGMAPALESMRVDVLDALKGRRSTFGAVSGSRFRAVLVAVQVALSFVLLVGSSLFLATHYQTINRQVGFETERVLMPRVTYRLGAGAPPAPSPSPAILSGALQRIPGMQAIAYAETAPVFGAPTMEVAGPGADFRPVAANEISPGFFDVLDLAILRGRALDERDLPCLRGICHVVVSESFARQVLDTADPVGRAVLTKTGVTLEIVGLARDTTVVEPTQADPPAMYLPWTPDGRGYQPLVRFTGSPGVYAPAVAAALRERFPEAIVDVNTLRWPIELWVKEISKVELLIVALGGAAVALAAMGVFGILSFAVARRRQELGIRVALGAGRRQIYATVVGPTVKPVAAGFAGGVALAVPTGIVFGNVLARLRLAASPTDPAIYAAAGVSLFAIILVALIVPARRAAAVSPLTALKSE
jgi:predicted permease